MEEEVPVHIPRIPGVDLRCKSLPCGSFDWYGANGTAFKTTAQCNFASWLQDMRAYPVIGPGMLRSMERARIAAAVPVDGVRDSYDGQMFCSAVSAG